MRSIFALTLSILLCVSSIKIYGQEIKIYNLYQLSRYLTTPDLDESSTDKIYSSLLYLIKTSNYNETDPNNEIFSRDLQNFMNSVEKAKKKSITAVLYNMDFSNSASITEIEQLGGDKKLIDLARANADNIKACQDSIAKIEKDSLQIKVLVQKLEIITRPSDEYTSYNDQICSLKKELDEKPFSQNDTASRKRIEEIINKYIFCYDNCDSINLEKCQDRKPLDNAIDELQESSMRLKGIKATIGSKMKQYLTERDSLLQLLAESIFEAKKKSLSSPISSRFIENTSIAQTAQQINISSIVHSAEQATSSSFRLPSESDLVNAMAAMLANRAKQEAVIWFMDKLRVEVHNPLVFDAFPSTYKMLNETASSSYTNFGHMWRFAISEDFINLPSNIFKSPWVERFLLKDNVKTMEEMKCLATSANELLKLVHAEYSYRDIIRYFYASNKRDSVGGKELYKIFDFLYMVTNEFFAIDSTGNEVKYRLLSFEEIATVDAAQWNVLKDLIKFKYGEEVFSILKNGSIADDQDTLEYNRWIGRLLLRLSQFDKLASQAKPTDNNAANMPNFWEILINVTNELQPNQKKSAENEEPYVKTIERFQSLLAIHQNIYNNNFEQATKGVMDLLASISKVQFEKITLTKDQKFQIRSSTFNTISIPYSKHLPKLKREVEFNFAGDSLQLKTIDTTGNSVEIVNGGFSIKKLIKDVAFLNYAHQGKNNEWKKIEQTVFDDTSELKKLWKAIASETVSSLDSSYNAYLALSLAIALKEDPYRAMNNPLYAGINMEEVRSFGSFRNIDYLIKFTTFFSDILHSTDSKSLASAIDRNILPPTSYIVKRKSRYSWTVNGYVGLIGGYQFVLSDASQFKPSPIYGITAPMGITYSKRTWGIFFQMIDLGNLVGHYLWETTEDYPRENVYFKQVISPGANIMGYFPRSPFAYFAGIKFIPVESTELPSGNKTNTNGLDLLQISAGIKIDIPIFNIYKPN